RASAAQRQEVLLHGAWRALRPDQARADRPPAGDRTVIVAPSCCRESAARQRSSAAPHMRRDPASSASWQAPSTRKNGGTYNHSCPSPTTAAIAAQAPAPR